ncbi:cytochrome P450 family 71 polypeptide [Rhynchospora pubera]|uniref:Cytochrome P450 family 71 polypeptide n=1 Tax=Rhynchospora pubera TaxID=906938 RepID=A0AAV8FKX7_9POAL|nr:cytochrome P450 family 71 polypeptide [Rhynchospora pubera]
MRDFLRQYAPLHFGPSPTILVSSPDAAREIMNNHDISFASRPITTTIDTLTFGGKGILFSPCGEYRRQMRKICFQELLSIRQVQSYRSIREEEIGNLIKYLNSCAPHYQPFNLSKKLASTVNGITMRAIIGSKKLASREIFARTRNCTEYCGRLQFN